MRLTVALLILVLGLCTLALLSANPAGASTATFTSAQIGVSGSTPQFSQSGPWTLAWSYNCTGTFGGTGNFIVNVNQPPGDFQTDFGTNELGSGGSGTDYYFDSGTFNLSIISLCQWSITVSSAGSGSVGTPATFTSAQIGVTGSTPQFSTSWNWTMAWSYNCSHWGSSGNFIVDITRVGGTSIDIGPNELGIGGSGTDYYTDAGTFHLNVLSECSWSITVTALAPPLPTPVTGMAATPGGGGYWLVDAQGGVSSHGNAVNYGSMAGTILNAPINHIVSTPDGGGYWLVAADGGTFAFGNAGFFGSMGGRHLNAPIVDIAPTWDGRGYWLVASDGGIFAFGDAGFHGSMGGQRLNKPVVGIAPDALTGGYWEVATDGGIFAFGAPFFGSTGAVRLNRPVNGMTPTPNDQGYWFVASDGGIFAYGNAGFFGSTGGSSLSAPVVGMATDTATGGYWLVGGDGSIYSYNAPFYGVD